jgi:glucose-fructose oxidoreductase
MTKTYRTAIIGFAHMHINNVAVLYHQHPQVEWAACAGTSPITPELRSAPYTREWNRARLQKELGISTYYEDYREMLRNEEIDIAIVTSENAQHPDICESCAGAGVAMCVEKPMARSMADAVRMARAARAAGVPLIVNWPFSWMPEGRKTAELVHNGAVGRPLMVKMRAAHTGPLGSGAHHEGVEEAAAPMTGEERAATWWHQEAAGGGAMLDFCGYGAMTSRWYLGESAVAVTGMRANLDSPWGDADDNGVMIVRYPHAMAVLEGSWTTHHRGIPSGPIVYGTEGTIVMDTAAPEGQTLRLERPGKDTEYVSCEPLPGGRSTVAGELIHHLDTGEPVHPSLAADFNLEVTGILDAGLRSADSGKTELVNSRSWHIG